MVACHRKEMMLRLSYEQEYWQLLCMGTLASHSMPGEGILLETTACIFGAFHGACIQRIVTVGLRKGLIPLDFFLL